jgi:SNF2 family DNA or RNA helicase
VVSWRNGPTGNLGVVDDASNGRVLVRFDSGETTQFAWPTPVLERIVYKVGDQVETKADHEVGVVTALAVAAGGVLVYQINLAGGASKSVIETGVRPAVITDPIALIRAGRLSSARTANLQIAATRILFAHQYDELSSLASSRVDIKEHQVAVLHRVATTYPHRFILADEVGLGKTIEAGLILKELRARGVAKRVLVLAPSGIVGQWQYELRRKFNEPFANYNKATITVLQAENPGDNVWTLRDSVIASTSYASWDEQRRKQIALAGWDLVIIDEAHHARRTREGEGRYRSTNLYRLAEALADPEQGHSTGFLLLTATPMQLDPFELYSLIDLLDPTLFADPRDFEQHRTELKGLNLTVDRLDRWVTLDEEERSLAREGIWNLLSPVGDLEPTLASVEGRAGLRSELAAKHRLSEVLIRNRKARVGGFMPRHASVWPVEMTELETEAYEAVTGYVRTGYAQSRAQKNNALGFLMAVFQKLNSSSSYAIRQSLLRRIEKLEDGLPSAAKGSEPEEDELEEGRAEDALDAFMGISARQRLEDEIGELARIVQLLDRIDMDSKTRALLAGLDELLPIEPDPKVLIFTQSRDTQDYLARHLAASRWTVSIFHGQLDAQEKDRAVAAFRDGTGPQILLSTEAGGEGRNFQFCHNLINYDLPWNPMKVEQRIGRLDRIGQKHDVRIFNFAVRGTIEERVLDVLANRIRVFEETIGGLDPILGAVESDLKHAFMLSPLEGKKALANLDEVLEGRIRNARQAERMLADLIMDTKSYRKDEVDELLGRRGPVDTDALKRFALGALAELGATIIRDERIPGAFELRLKGQFENNFPQFVRDGLVRRVTFDPSVARDHEDLEFLAVGHEIVDALLGYVRSKEHGARASVRVIKTSELPPAEGWFFTFVLEFEAVRSLKEVFAVFVNADGVVDGALADWLLDRSMRLKREDWDEPTLPVREETLGTAVQLASDLALARLMARQAELEVTNCERVAQERDKLERFYKYKGTAADEKVTAVRATLERLSGSVDADVQRILPVWRKNLQNAERDLDAVAGERERRLAQLTGQETVTAQTETLTASWVEIVPDDAAPEDVE